MLRPSWTFRGLVSCLLWVTIGGLDGWGCGAADRGWRPAGEKATKRSAFHSPQILPSTLRGVRDAHHRVPPTCGAGASSVITQSQSRRLKMMYKLAQTMAIRTIAKG